MSEIKSINAESEKIFTSGVEREKLGAKADLIMGANTNSDNDIWARFNKIGSGTDDGVSLSNDTEIGDVLYAIASENCASQLAACGDTAEMERILYSRQITADCKSFDSYLDSQKTAALQNQELAQAEVRKVRSEMYDTTNKYNRGECLLAYKACVSFTAGCGADFENCMDEDLLIRRAHTCDDVLDQCTAERKNVEADWLEEIGSSEKRGTIMWQAAEYEKYNKPLSCRSKALSCLEEGCATSTNTMCLTDINVAAGICPIIDDCENIPIPGFRDSIKDEMKSLAAKRCESDLATCFADRCGKNMTDPVCLGADVRSLCNQDSMVSCKSYSKKDFTSLVDFTLIKLKDAQSVMCLNYIDELMGKSACGLEMDCIAVDSAIQTLTSEPSNPKQFQEKFVENTEQAVDKFFDEMASESVRVAACDKAASSKTADIFGEAKLLGKIAAVKRMERAYQEKLNEISRTKDIAEAKKRCTDLYESRVAQNSTSTRDELKEGSWTTEYIWEPDLRNCRITRYERVCEESGISTSSLLGKNIAGGAATGLSAGMGFGPWGAAIGTVVGGIGGGILGAAQGGETEPYCHTVGPITEDINL
jgi:hypothetical protein